MRSFTFKSERIILIALFVILSSCSKTDYYSEIRKDCDLKKAERFFTTLTEKNDTAIIKVIEAMADCRSQDMDRFLSERYLRSDRRTKEYIYQNLIKNKSLYFADTLVDVLINKIETKEDYAQTLSDIISIDPNVLNKKYEYLIEQLKISQKSKNTLTTEIYLEKISSLSKVLKKEFNKSEIMDEIRSIKDARKRDELYSKFLDATNNQKMDRAFQIYSKLTQKGWVENNNSHKKLYKTLKEMSEIEKEFYDTAQRVDRLMIDIEIAKRAGEEKEVKRLQSELNFVKSSMVLKKRALDRAAKRLELVRELFFEVKKKR